MPNSVMHHFVINDTNIELRDSGARTEITNLKGSLTELDEVVNGSGGGSQTVTTPFEVTWTDGYYIDRSGPIYSREGSSISNFISIPDNAEKITIKGSAATTSGGYAFYTRANYSYYIEGSSGTLRDGDNIVTVDVTNIPEGAEYFAFTTLVTNQSASGATYTYTQISPASDGLVGAVEDLQNGKQDAPETAGTAGQVLGLDANLAPIWKDPGGNAEIDDTAGSGATTKTWSANKLSGIKDTVDDLDEAVNGSGGSQTHTEQLTTTYTTGYYIEYSSGLYRNRTAYSISGFIEIPENAESITVKGSSGINASGYCFYTSASQSYGIDNSGGSLKGITEVTISSIPEGAKYIAFSTQDADLANSGVWATWTEVDPSGQGLAANVETLMDKAENIDDMLSPCADKSSEITWTDGYRIIRIYGENSSSAYKIGKFNASRGDKIIIEHSEEIPRGTVQISEVVTIGGGTTYRPLVPEVPASYIEYIAQQDMQIAISVKKASLTNLKWYAMPVNNDSLDTTDNQTAVFPWGKVTQILSASRKNPMSAGARKQRPFVLAHISDIHNNRVNSKSFKEFIERFGGYIDDAIITGDMAGSKYPDYVPIWEQTGYNKVLLTIGNHDVYDYAGTHGSSDYYNREYFATEKQTYDQYFAPSISNWGVTQPTDASTNGYCFYYKDYSITQNADSSTVSTIRLIVLNPMHYNATQHTWLEAVLTDAKTNGYPVVIAEHFIPMETLTDMNLFDTSFSSLMPGMRDYFGLYFLSYVDGSEVRHKAADLVDDFITAGGEFVCWICGHEHFDMVGTLNSHPNQIFIAVGTASAYPINAYADMPREYGTESENLINIFSVDTFYKTIRVGRVGATIDDHMRHRGGMCIDYANRTLVSSW